MCIAKWTNFPGSFSRRGSNVVALVLRGEVNFGLEIGQWFALPMRFLDFRYIASFRHQRALKSTGEKCWPNFALYHFAHLSRYTLILHWMSSPVKIKGYRDRWAKCVGQGFKFSLARPQLLIPLVRDRCAGWDSTFSLPIFIRQFCSLEFSELGEH